MIGYFIAGPLLALLISLKLTDRRFKNHQVEYETLAAKVQMLELQHDQVDKEMLKKIMATLMPIAKAVNKLNQEVGL